MDSRRTLKAVAAGQGLAVGSSSRRRAPEGRDFLWSPKDHEAVPVPKIHLLRCQDARDALERWLLDRGLEGYVGSEQNVYWDVNDLRRVVAPDVFVALGVSGRPRTNYRVWVEGPLPCFVLEILSPSTRRCDLGEKKAIYERMGVREYFVFEGEEDRDDGGRRRGPRIDPPLQGFRLRQSKAGRQRYEPIPAWQKDELPSGEVTVGYSSDALGLGVACLSGCEGVRFFDRTNRAFVMTTEEARRAERDRAEAAESRAEAAETRVAKLERLLARREG